jgi:isoquinoline 1-oxidoreductase beta subunit
MSSTQKPITKRRITRRGFLITLGVGAAGLYLGVRLATPPLRLRLAEWLEDSGGPPSNIDAPPDAWFEILADNRVRLYVPKVEMGQGVHTALGQIAAEELEIAWEQLEVRQVGTGQRLDDPVGTSASNTISSLYQPLREVSATLRELLKAEAARQLAVSPDALVIQNGVISDKNDASRHRTYAELFQAAGEWQLPDKPPALKEESQFRFIGESLPRVDLPAKITGEAVYGFDVRLPGMLYGAVARSDTIEGKLARAQAGEAASMPGVVKVVIEPGFAGVVAESRAEAYRALGRMQLEWEPGRLWQQSEIEAMVSVGVGEGVVIQKEGDTAAALRGQQVFEVEYRTPMAYHAYMEPLAAVADATPEKVQVWASTQAAVRLRGSIAKTLKRDEASVIVMPVYLGGGFGRKIDETVAVDAARLSAAVGRPVHVGMNRAEDFRNGFVRPPTHHRFRGLLGGDGSLQAIEHLQASGEVAFAFLPGFVGSVMGADFGSWRGALIPYAAPNKQTTAWLARLPVYTGWWRGLGLMPNIFALESFIDELAYAAGVDPLEFRLSSLGDDETGSRLKNVLQAAAEKADWGSPLPAGSGRGIACSIDAGTAAAEVVEVSLQDGQVRVLKVTAAIDPGLIVNPDGVEAQTQGAITMGLSAALLEEATIKDGKFEAANFDRYPLLRNSEAPDVEVVLLESGLEPHGMGEPPIGPIAAAAANAIFAASGQRLRRLPLKLN